MKKKKLLYIFIFFIMLPFVALLLLFNSGTKSYAASISDIGYSYANYQLNSSTAANGNIYHDGTQVTAGSTYQMANGRLSGGGYSHVWYRTRLSTSSSWGSVQYAKVSSSTTIELTSSSNGAYLGTSGAQPSETTCVNILTPNVSFSGGYAKVTAGGSTWYLTASGGGATTTPTQIDSLLTAVSTPNTTFTYNGSVQTLSSSSGYTLSGTYFAINAGTYTAVATLNSGYKWSDGTTVAKTIKWTINQATLSNTTATISNYSSTYQYTGSTISINPTVKVGGRTLTKDTDYTLSILKNTTGYPSATPIEIGSYYIRIDAKGNYTGAASAKFSIVKADQTFSFSNQSIDVIDGTTTLDVSSSKVNYPSDKFSFTSSDTDVATISSSGVITAGNKVGSSTITVTNSGNDYYNSRTTSFTLTTTLTNGYFIGSLTGDNTCYKTLSEALSAANSGDTIYIKGENKISSDLIIDKNITLKGYDSNSKITIDTKNAGIRVNDGITLNIDTITFDGANITSEKAFITNENNESNTINITDSKFINFISTTNSSVLDINNGEITISNSTFESNTGVNGGAIYISDSTINLTNSTFNKNTATTGGAIYAKNSEVTINSGSINANTAKLASGVYLNNTKLNLDSTTLTKDITDNLCIDDSSSINLTGVISHNVYLEFSDYESQKNDKEPYSNVFVMSDDNETKDLLNYIKIEDENYVFSVIDDKLILQSLSQASIDSITKYYNLIISEHDGSTDKISSDDLLKLEKLKSDAINSINSGTLEASEIKTLVTTTIESLYKNASLGYIDNIYNNIDYDTLGITDTTLIDSVYEELTKTITDTTFDNSYDTYKDTYILKLKKAIYKSVLNDYLLDNDDTTTKEIVSSANDSIDKLLVSTTLDDLINDIITTVSETKLSVEKNRAKLEITDAYNETKNDTTLKIYNDYLTENTGIIYTLDSVDDVLLNKEIALNLIKLETLKDTYETDLSTDSKKEEKLLKVNEIIEKYPTQIKAGTTVDEVESLYQACVKECNDMLADYDSATFKADHNDLLNKELSSIISSDLDDINSALSDYETYLSSSQEGEAMSVMRTNLLEKKKSALTLKLEESKTTDTYVNDLIDTYIEKINNITSYNKDTNSLFNDIDTECSNAKTLEEYKTSVIESLKTDASITTDDSNEVSEILEEYINTIRNTVYDNNSSIDSQKTIIDDLKSEGLTMISNQRLIDEAKDYLDTLREDDDSTDVNELFSEYLDKLQNLLNTSTNLSSDIEALKVEFKDKLDEQRESEFEAYKANIISILDNTLTDDSTDEYKELLTSKDNAITAIKYDSSKTLSAQYNSLDILKEEDLLYLTSQKNIDDAKDEIRNYKQDSDILEVDTIIENCVTSLQALLDKTDITSSIEETLNNAKLEIEKVRAKEEIKEAYNDLENPIETITTVKDNYVKDSGIIDSSVSIDDVNLNKAKALSKIKISTIIDSIKSTIDESDTNYDSKVEALTNSVLDYINNIVDSKTTISDVEVLYDEAYNRGASVVAEFDRNKFNNDHKSIVEKKVSDITFDDLTLINEALTDFTTNYTEVSQEALNDIYEDLLNKKKAAYNNKLDSLKTTDTYLNKVIDNYKNKIDVLTLDDNTSVSIESIYEESLKAITLEEYKTQAINEINSLISTDSSKEAKDIVNEATSLIRDTSYDSTKSVDEQKLIIDEFKISSSASVKEQILIDSYKDQINIIETEGSQGENAKKEALESLQNLKGAYSSEDDLKNSAQSIVDEAKKDINVGNTKDLNPTLDIDFSNIKSSDLDNLNKTLDYIEDLMTKTDESSLIIIEELNKEAKAEGYANILNSVKDKVAKSTYEVEKEEALEEIKTEVRVHDGKRVTEILNQVKTTIESDYNYQKYTVDSKIEEHLTSELLNLENGKNGSIDKIQVGQKQEQVSNIASEDTTSKISSKNYNQAQTDELNDILERANEKIDNIDKSKSKDEQKEELNKILEETQKELSEVKVSSVTQGDIYADKTSKSDDSSLAEYSKDTNQIWGIVSNDAGLESDIVLKIDEAESNILKDIKKAASKGNVKFSDDATYTLDDVPSLIDNKDIKGTLDIYLLQGNVKIEEFEGYYVVKILMDEDLRKTEGLQVVYMQSDGTIEIYNTTIEDSKFLVFTTSHFSEFVILGNEEDNDINLLWLIISIGIIILVEIIGLCMIIKNNNENKKEQSMKVSSTTLPLIILAIYPKHAIPIIIGMSALVLVLLIFIIYEVFKNKNNTESKKEVKEITLKEESNTKEIKPVLNVVKEEIKNTNNNIVEDNKVYYIKRYAKTFKAKLSQASDEAKAYYNDIKNHFLSFDFKNQISKKFETFKTKDVLLRLGVKGKTLVLYSSVDASAYDDLAHFKTEVDTTKEYIDTPNFYKITSKRKSSYVIKLINNLVKEYNISSAHHDYIDYAKEFPYETLAYLIMINEAKEFDIKVNFEPKVINVTNIEANKLINDNEAKELIKESNIDRNDKVKTEVSLDTLVKYFKSNDIIDISSMKKVIPDFKNSATYVKITNGNVIDKKLTVIADEFDLTALKMINLAQGETFITKKVK